MNDKVAYEAFRVRQFASAHPILQAPAGNCQTAQQPQHANASTCVTRDTMGKESGRGNCTAMQQQQLLPDHQRVIIHFDVDCFYCQVEEVRNPSLRGRPVAVTQKYLVVTANYEARGAGVTKLMGIADARKACPQLTLVPGEDLTPYRAASRAIHAVLSRWGPCEKLGLDESWVDVTKEVLHRLHSGASSRLTPSLVAAEGQWPAHIYNSSVALMADSKHRPQDLRVAAAAMPFAWSTAAAAALSEQGRLADRADSCHSTCDLSTGAAPDAVGFSGSHALQRTPDIAVCTKTAAAANTPSDSGDSSGGLRLSSDWQAKLYVGCVIAAEMREAVLREAGYRCSAGIAFNKLLSKLVSGLHKPNDQTALPPTEAQACVARLPVRALRGVGYKAEGVLKGWGVVTAGDVAALSKQQLIEGLGDRRGLWLYGACRGVDPSPVMPTGAPKTISVEDSFKGCSSWAQIDAVLKVLVPDLLERLEEDAAEHGPRTPSTLSVKWRKAGTGWHRTSASAPWPSLTFPSPAAAPTLELLDSSVSGDVTPGLSQSGNPKHVQVVTAAALKVLKQHLTGSFNLTLLNIGMTGFKDATAAAGAGGIKRFFQQKGTAAAQPAVAPSAAVPTPDATALLQSAINSTAARRNYAAVCTSAEAGALTCTVLSEQQQGRNSAAARPVLLSKRQERRLLEQALQQQQQRGVFLCGQQEQDEHGQQQQFSLACSPPAKRVRVHEQQQQVLASQQQQPAQLHPAAAWQHSQQQQQQMCIFEAQQQQNVGLQQQDHEQQQHTAWTLQHPEQQPHQQQMPSLQPQQQLCTSYQHRKQLEQQCCGSQQPVDMRWVQQEEPPQQQRQATPDDMATTAAAMHGSVQHPSPRTISGCTAGFELHDLAGWGCFSCQVVEGFDEDGDANDDGDL